MALNWQVYSVKTVSKLESSSEVLQLTNISLNSVHC